MGAPQHPEGTRTKRTGGSKLKKITLIGLSLILTLVAGLVGCVSERLVTQTVLLTQTVTQTQTLTETAIPPTITSTVTETPTAVTKTVETTRTVTPSPVTVTTTPPPITETITVTTTLPPVTITTTPPLTVDDLRRSIFEEVNKIRAEHGLSALIRDTYLDTIANDHAFTMMALGYITHWGFEDRANEIFAAMPHVTQVGENLAYVNLISYDTIGKYFAETWYESPEHRENMLDPLYKRTGIGLQVFWENLTVPNYYAVQLFTD